MKTTHDLVQGSDEWAEFRMSHYGASEAAAMLGISPTMTRRELLKAKHTGIAREFSAFVQERVLDKGHEVEALARPHVDKLIGAELFPVTLSDGKLSASCDGLDLLDEFAFEHKQWSEPLAESVRAGIVPDYHMAQCQQVLMVSGAEKLIFVVSDGTPDRMVYTWVAPDLAWFERITAGWAQFERDLEAYVLPESAKPAPVGTAPDTLPALRIEVTGAVTASNLAEFKATALGAIRSVNRQLRTDQDFADAEKAVKWCADVESRLKAAKEHALSQTSSIDALFKALDDISAEARTVRLDLDKLVARRKVEVKEEAVTKARRALDEHVAQINAELAPLRLQALSTDFAGAIKGLRTVASIQDKLDAALAAAKLEADAAARVVRQNIDHFKTVAAGRESLFADLGQLVHRSPEDFRELVQARVLAQQERDRKAEEARQAAEAARIAAAEQRAREQAQAEARAAEQRRLAEEAAEAKANMEAALREASEKFRRDMEAERVRALEQGAKAAAQSDSVPAFELVATPEGDRGPAPAEPATINLSAIGDRLGFTLPAAFLAQLGIEPARVDKNAKFYRESDFGRLCVALRAHIAFVQISRSPTPPPTTTTTKEPA